MGPYLSIKNKEKFIMLKQLSDKVNVICCLPKSTLLALQKHSMLQQLDVHQLMDIIITKFQADFEDISFFYRGEEKKTIFNVWKSQEERDYITFQLDTKSFEKLIVYKNTYSITKSEILKRFIKKYILIRENEIF